MSGRAADTGRASQDWTLPLVGGQTHASCVAVGARAVLICGPSGSGKSSLALQLLSLGAVLVSDDQTQLTRDPDGVIIASAPHAIRGLIEARGIGLLRAETAAQAQLHVVVDLAVTETSRLPRPRYAKVLNARLRLLHNSDSTAFPAAILQYLKRGEVVVP